MATRAEANLAKTRARGIGVAGLAITFLGVGAAVMPAGKGLSSDVLGALLIAAGLIELVAGSLRRQVRLYAMAAGGVTAFAGLLFLINPETQFFPTVTVIIAWLVIRSLVLGFASTLLQGSVRLWMALSAGMDFVLAALLIAGLSIATIIVSVFGPTSQLIASFAWVFAASLVVTGLLLLEVASCERQDYAKGDDRTART